MRTRRAMTSHVVQTYLSYWSSMPKTTAYSYKTKHTDIEVFKRRLGEHAALANVRLLDDDGATTFQDFFRAMPRAKKIAHGCEPTDEEIDAAVANTRAQLNEVDHQLEDLNRQLERIELLMKIRF